MKTLILLRHAKSDRSAGAVDDHDRPLAPRGRKAAPEMGARIAAHVPPPHLVLCSTALRARETLALALAAAVDPGGWPVLPSIGHERGLYLCGPEALLRRIGAVDESVHSLMVVGHNPDFEVVARRLAVEGEPADLARLAAKYPTAGAAILHLDGEWSQAGRGGRLGAFLTPADGGD
jgi:phosphohistidine phosphatase